MLDGASALIIEIRGFLRKNKSREELRRTRTTENIEKEEMKYGGG